MQDLKLNVSKNYGEKCIFRDFSLTVPAGKITCVLGASGSGKTTLLRILANTTEYTGEILGQDGNVSYVFQEDRLVPFLTVKKNLALVLPKEWDEQRTEREISEMLGYLEIEEEANRYPAKLSGGQRQRVSMARAFLYPSDLLLMDEPFHSLDIGLKHRLLEVFLKLHARRPKTTLLVTHGVDEALLVADRVVVIGESPARIVYERTVDLPQSSRRLTSPELIPVRSEILTALTAQEGAKL